MFFEVKNLNLLFNYQYDYPIVTPASQWLRFSIYGNIGNCNESFTSLIKMKVYLMLYSFPGWEKASLAILLQDPFI